MLSRVGIALTFSSFPGRLPGRELFEQPFQEGRRLFDQGDGLRTGLPVQVEPPRASARSRLMPAAAASGSPAVALRPAVSPSYPTTARGQPPSSPWARPMPTPCSRPFPSSPRARTPVIEVAFDRDRAVLAPDGARGGKTVQKPVLREDRRFRQFRYFGSSRATGRQIPSRRGSERRDGRAAGRTGASPPSRAAGCPLRSGCPG